MIEWPPDYVSEYARRLRLVKRLRNDPKLIKAADAYYSTNFLAFNNDWGVTVDPRNAGSAVPVNLPFITFKKQDEFAEFLLACFKGQANGLVEKSRDMGATWMCVSFSVWLWKYYEASAVGWGSRKKELVDKIGDPSSIFEKIRIFIRFLPRELWPQGFNPNVHCREMKVLNPANGAAITGEIGDSIGRGGRTTIYFKDESAHYEHPEMIEGSLGDNTNVQIDISSVHGLGNVFHRKRENGIEWLPGQEIVKGQTNVFVMDWSDHPAKTKTWHDERKKKWVADGLGHIFATEVDRDYAASLEGAIIPAEWIESATDADLKLDYLGNWDNGLYGAGLDVADEGIDRNALALRKGPKLVAVDEWGERNTGATTRRATSVLSPFTPLNLQYDCIGIGAGVKAEANRLLEDPEVKFPKDLVFVPWNAGAVVLYPERRVIEPTSDDPEELRNSPKNKDFYTNLKAQGWWELRRRFEKTHRAVTEGEVFPIDEMISISSKIPLLRTLQKELAQPTAGLGHRLKLIVNKKPEGAKSPNLGDAVVMAFWPLPPPTDSRAVFGSYGYGSSR